MAEDSPLDSPLWAVADAVQSLGAKVLGRHVVLDVDGERVAGEVTEFGTQEPEPTTGSVWYVAVDGRRVSVVPEDLERLCGGDDGE